MDKHILPPHRMTEFGCLSDSEIARLRALGGAPIHLPRETEIRSEGTEDRSVYHLVDGWASASMRLRDGQRQIIKLHLPGDLLGSTSMCFDAAIDTLTALTPVTVRKISLDALGRLIMSSPRIAAYTILAAQKERIAVMDRLAWVGRSDAVARIAACFLDLHSRLSVVGLVTDNRFRLPITQTQLGDQLGLTAVHVNRVLHQFERDGLLERQGRLIHIADLPRLQAIAALVPRTVSRDIGWLGLDETAGDDRPGRLDARPTQPLVGAGPV